MRNQWELFRQMDLPPLHVKLGQFPPQNQCYLGIRLVCANFTRKLCTNIESFVYPDPVTDTSKWTTKIFSKLELALQESESLLMIGVEMKKNIRVNYHDSDDDQTQLHRIEIWR